MATQATLHSQTGSRHGATFDCQAPAKLDKADRQSLQTAGVRDLSFAVLPTTVPIDDSVPRMGVLRLPRAFSLAIIAFRPLQSVIVVWDPGCRCKNTSLDPQKTNPAPKLLNSAA